MDREIGGGGGVEIADESSANLKSRLIRETQNGEHVINSFKTAANRMKVLNAAVLTQL